MKGFVSWGGSSRNDFSYSMEYVPVYMSDLMVGENSFSSAKLEDVLSGVAGRKHQAVVRIIFDEPNVGLHVPAYILDKIKTFSYSDGGNSGSIPDYNDQYFVKFGACCRRVFPVDESCESDGKWDSCKVFECWAG